MKINLYAIFDTASGVHDGPLRSRADAEAIRDFSGLVMNAETKVGKNPEDFYLVRIGIIDDNTGVLIPESPETLVTGLECVAESRKVGLRS